MVLTLETLGGVKMTPHNILECHFFIVNHIVVNFFIAMDSSIVDNVTFFILTITLHHENIFHDPTLPV